MLESTVIFKSKHIKKRLDFFQISPYLTDISLRENNIEIENGYKRFMTKTKTFSLPHFHTPRRFSFFYLDIPFLLVKSLMKFDTRNGGCSLSLST